MNALCIFLMVFSFYWGNRRGGLAGEGSVLFSHSVLSDSFRPHGLQHTRLPCPSPTPWACSKSCLSSWWCHPVILSSILPYSSCLLSFAASGSFPMSQFFASGCQSIGASPSASVLPMNIQVWFPLKLTGFIPMQSKGLSRVFFNATVQKHDFFGAQLSLWCTSHIHTWLLGKAQFWLWTFVGKVMSLFFNMLSRLVIAFLRRSKGLLISWLQLQYIVILEPNKIHLDRKWRF